MSSKAEMITTFIAKCGKEDKDPIEEAKRIVLECDEELKKIAPLHRKRADMVAVLLNLGDDTFRQHRGTMPVTEIEFEDDTEASKDIRRMILAKLKSNGPMTMSELIKGIATPKEDYAIVRNVKYLAENGQVRKDEEDRVVLV